MKEWQKLCNSNTASRLCFDRHDIASQLDWRGHYAVQMDEEFPLLIKLFHYTRPTGERRASFARDGSLLRGHVDRVEQLNLDGMKLTRVPGVNESSQRIWHSCPKILETIRLRAPVSNIEPDRASPQLRPT